MPVSLAPKPEPVTVTELPAAPLDRLRDMLGVTVKGTLAALLTKPFAPMLCEPEAEAGTTNVAVQPPEGSAVIPRSTVVLP
jgi:hypothetical protein